MPQKSITDISLVKSFLDTVGGGEAIKLVKICERKRKEFTDEDVSKQMNMKVTEVRAILNRLHYRGIACYQKSRNQKTGWYNYTWEIKNGRIAELIHEKEKENLTKLQEKMSLETDYNLFDCNTCSERLPFEVAAEYNFICPSCGGVMDSTNSPNKQKEINKKIRKIEQELSLLSQMTG